MIWFGYHCLGRSVSSVDVRKEGNARLPKSCCILGCRIVGLLHIQRPPRLKQLSAIALYGFWRAAPIIGIVLAGAAGAQEPPVPSTYFFPDSNEAMAKTFLDPHISNETKQALTRLIEARHWPVEYQDPKTKLMWLYRPGRPPMLEGVRPSNVEARK
jgi:hypothetical protein